MFKIINNKIYLRSWLLLRRRFLERWRFSSELLSSSEAAVLKSSWDWVWPNEGFRLGGVLKVTIDAAETGLSFLAEAEVDLM